MRVLERRPLKYKIVAQTGSHRKLVSDNGYPDIDFCFHDKDTIPPGLVRQILVTRVGLTEEEARKKV